MTKAATNNLTEVDIAIARLYLRRQNHFYISGFELMRKEKCMHCPQYPSMPQWHYIKAKHWGTKSHICGAFNIPMTRLNQAITVAKVMKALDDKQQ